MKDCLLKVAENRQLGKDLFKMVLEGDVTAITAPGQFINIKLSGLFLRRPISVNDCDGKTVTIIYKVVGKGTEQLSAMAKGEELMVLTGLGNGFDPKAAGDAPLLIGGGIGTAPMYMLAKELIALGKKVQVVMGFNSAADVFYEEEFKALGCSVAVTTVDGSRGLKGFVTDALPGNASYFYACGPEPMLKAVYKAANKLNLEGELSFEERMGCGFGACMGCSCKTLTGYKRICKDGPVMKKEEILWED